MRTKILSGALAWVLFITILHLQLNVGWKRLTASFGGGRQELKVGFLPVT